MCQRIEKTLKTYERVFVIAGLHHFSMVKDGVKGIDYTPSNQAIEETKDFLKTKKFIILSPKYR